MYPRLSNPLLSNSFFLLGPRGTGKTSLLKSIFKDKKVLWIDLLKEDELLSYIKNPSLLHEQLEKTKSSQLEWVVIDEIQKLPALLNEVHSKIEDTSFSPKLKFALTGSSARKLKRGAANLLAGRAFVNNLHPLTSIELADFSLEEILNWGSLPKVIDLEIESKKEFLRTYANIYLKEEIKEEQLLRKIDPFVRFLEVAAQCNSQIINFSKIGRDCKTDSKAVERYFQILEDTLIGFFLDPYHKSIRKRQNKKPKFYFFDPGVKKALEGTLNVPLQAKTYAYGKAFEHFIILECIRLNDYYRKDYRFSYFSTDSIEIDLIIERPGDQTLLVEIKSSSLVDPLEIKKITSVSGNFQNSRSLILSQEKNSRISENVEIFNWQEGLKVIFGI